MGENGHNSKNKRFFHSRKNRLLIIALIFLALLAIYFLINTDTRKDIRFVAGLKVGWNLGNTLDSHGLDDRKKVPADYETYWGNPYTTKEMIAAVKKAGFNTIRVPVSWHEHMDEAYNVDSAWMERVAEIVGYCMENDLYVILNAHHEDWYIPDESHRQSAVEIMRKLWKQIADRFENYGEHLLFEGMNEPRLIGMEHEWDEGTKEARSIVNKLNEVFVNTVRTAGGQNKERYLLIPTYCAGIGKKAMEELRLPHTSRLIVSLHLYKPYEFALNEKGTAKWDASNPEDTREIDQAIENARRLFISKGIPVIIGEFGAVDKKNTQDRTAWASYIIKKASASDIVCVWWDDSIFDRRTLTWRYPGILEALTSAKQ